MMMRMRNILSAQDISKDFKGKTAVSRLSLEIVPGRIMGLLGPNGAGKSTTLRMMCGLIQPNSGQITFRGKSVEKWKNNLYSHLSCVLEDSSLAYMFLTGWNNLAYQGALYGLSRKETLSRSRNLMDALELTEHMNKPVGDSAEIGSGNGHACFPGRSFLFWTSPLWAWRWFPREIFLRPLRIWLIQEWELLLLLTSRK